MNAINLKKIAKIIEGYIELLCLFPHLSTVKLENINSEENFITVTISRLDKRYEGIVNVVEQINPTMYKTIFTLSLVIDKQIIEEDDHEIKPE